MFVVGTFLIALPLGMLSVVAVADMGTGEFALVLMLIVVLVWGLFSSAFGLTTWIGPRRILVHGHLFTTRVALRDIDAVYVVDAGEIVLRLRDDRRVRVWTYLRSQPLRVFGTAAAKRAAELIRGAIGERDVANKEPVVVQRGWWPVPVHLTLAVTFCLTALVLFARSS